MNDHQSGSPPPVLDGFPCCFSKPCERFDCQPFTALQSALSTVGYFGIVVCNLQMKDLLLFLIPDQFESNVLQILFSRAFSGVSLYGDCFWNSSSTLTGRYGMSTGCVIVWL